MRIMLEQLIDVLVGQNLYRGALAGSVDALPVYTNEDLQNDLYMAYSKDAKPMPRNDSQDLRCVEAGHILYALSIGRAAIGSSYTAGKVLNPNFAIITIKDKTILDPNYLCYILNESRDIQRQKNEIAQGSILMRVTPKQVKELQVALPSIEQQQSIGALYMKALHYTYLQQRESHLSLQTVLGVLQGIQQGEK